MNAEPRVNVLLVDDRPENLVALESVLADLGQNLVMAHSGREALKHLLDDDFAVILLDVQMPEMDGFETASLIRSRPRSQHTPIVFLTAINKSDNHVSRGYSVGGVDYVFKPFQPEVLRAKVAAFVDLSKKSRELEQEILRRKEAEEEVRQLNQGLERRVAERTAALEATNQELQNEVAERRRVEEERTRLLEREQAARAEAEAAQQRLAFLGEASAILADSLAYHPTLKRVARLAVPYVGDLCFVDLFEEGGPIEPVAAAHLDPTQDGALREAWADFVAGLTAGEPLLRVLRSDQPELVAEVTEDLLRAGAIHPDHLELVRRVGIESFMRVPLVVRGRTLGGMAFAIAGSGRRYSAADLVLAQDLARRAAAAIDNARLFQEVQEAARRKDEFLAMLAHELRNPLSAISNADYALQALDAPDPKVGRLRAVISRQVNHLARMVDDLLDIARITRGKIELRKESVDLSRIVLRAVEGTMPLMEHREHSLSVSLPDEPLWMEADPTRLEQILWNLLNNAAKYTEPGGRVWLTATHEREEGRDWAVFRVRDAGVGIPPELLPRIFELFTQGERALDRSQGGLGIGLALVRNLVHLHGGSIHCASAGRGAGSEFMVRLPALAGCPAGAGICLPEDAGPNGVAARRSGQLARQPPARGARVLIVEDNMDAAETLTDILHLWGHDVRVALSGPAALEEAPRYHPEVVLLDIGLPGMNGLEVARRLRAQPELQAALLVALTGYGQDEDRRRSEEAGFDLHLTKPVDPKQLQRLLADRPVVDPSPGKPARGR
jgi:signal transduction histidine kinase/DNA-binding response OmpR family regulator